MHSGNVVLVLDDEWVGAGMEAALGAYVLVKFLAAGVVVEREEEQVCVHSVAAAMTGKNVRQLCFKRAFVTLL